MKKWFVVMVMVLLAATSWAKDNEDVEDCVRRDICWKGQPCICDYPWLLTLAWGIISVDVQCEDGSPAAERLVQIRREFLGTEREKITNANGNVKFLAGIGSYVVMVEGEEQKVIVPGLFLTRDVSFDLICFPTTTTTIIPTTISTTIPTTSIEPTTTSSIVLTTSSTSTSIHHHHSHPSTTVPVTTSIPEQVTTTIPTEPTTTSIEECTTTTSIKECRSTTTTLKQCHTTTTGMES